MGDWPIENCDFPYSSCVSLPKGNLHIGYQGMGLHPKTHSSPWPGTWSAFFGRRTGISTGFHSDTPVIPPVVKSHPQADSKRCSLSGSLSSIAIICFAKNHRKII